MFDNLKRVRKSISSRMKMTKVKLKHKRLAKLPIEEIADYLVLKQNNKKGVSVSPKYVDQKQYKLNYPAVDIKLYHLKNVFCNINSASFVTQDMKSIYIEEFPYINCEQANYKSGLLVQHDARYAYIKNIEANKARRIENALFLGGNGSFNYYHWMIEIAPKLLLLNKKLLKSLEINTIIINDCVVKNDNYTRILEQCAKHLTGVHFIYISQEKVFFVERLYIINTFNQTVYNYKKIPQDYQITTIYNKDVLEQLDHRLSKSVPNKITAAYKKVFILRNEKTVSKYNNRTYNQDEVFSFFEKQGFIGIYPDSFTIDEQINIFKQADFIVGPTGASWSNLVFCKESTKAISWLPKSLKYLDTYSTLANLNKVDMRFVKYDVTDNSIHEPYKVEINDLIILYHSMTESN